LEERLQNGPVDVSDFDAAIERHEFDGRSAEQAKAKLGLVARRVNNAAAAWCTYACRTRWRDSGRKKRKAAGMPIEDIEFYSERRDLSLDVLSLNLIRQLSHLAWRALQADGRESTYVDENDRFHTARIAPIPAGMAVVEGGGKVERYLIEEDDDDAFRLKARRRLFAFEADDPMAPGNWRFRPASPPDIWHNMEMTTLMLRLDSHG
jgi:hypothetical protein